MESPCVKICAYRPGTEICEGCGRTGEEITRWRDMTDAERREIMALLPARLERLKQG